MQYNKIHADMTYKLILKHCYSIFPYRSNRNFVVFAFKTDIQRRKANSHGLIFSDVTWKLRQKGSKFWLVFHQFSLNCQSLMIENSRCFAVLQHISLFNIKLSPQTSKITKIVKLTLTTNNVWVINRLPKILTFDTASGCTGDGSRCWAAWMVL